MHLAHDPEDLPRERTLRPVTGASLRLVALLGLGACGGKPPPPPAAPCTLPVTVNVTASPRVNPDERGEALPTRVRILQLTHAARAEEAGFGPLWEQLEETLGDHLIDKREITVYPGSVESVSLDLDPRGRYLVGMGVFRQPTGAQWRAIVPLPTSERLCAAYREKQELPAPAVDFSLDGHRLEARSHLLRTRDSLDLPSDVTSGADGAGSEREAQRSSRPH